jgi:hypothetical protein
MTGLKELLEEANSQSTDSAFQNCWSPSGSNFFELRKYTSSIATVIPGTICVQSDFSLNNWIKDPNSRRLTDFSLEAILRCKQYGQLEKLFDEYKKAFLPFYCEI